MSSKSFLKEIGVLIALCIILGLGIDSLLNPFEPFDYMKVRKLKKNEKEYMQFMSPELKTNYLRYRENNDADSLAWMKKHLDQLKEEQKLNNEVLAQLNEVKSLISKKEFGEAIDLIVTIKGELRNFRLMNSDSLRKELDSLRVNLYNEAKNK